VTFLAITLSGEHGADVFRALARTPAFAAAPVSIEHEHENIDAVPAEWPEAVLRARTDGRARWPSEDLQLGYRPRSGPLVVASIPVDTISVEGTLAILEPLPFDICAFGAKFFDEWIAANYDRWTFSRGHIDHGWACAFRGVGHDRLMSRRWLDFGPWRVIRRPNDTTFIQFHDLDITDPAEAYDQAKVGHERMGVSKIGGFIQQIPDSMLDSVRGLYTPGQRRLDIVVPPGVTVEQYDMKCACAVRLHYRLDAAAGRAWKPGTIGPLDSLAYNFVDEEQARAHLHELWLREIECWVADDKGKRRLDLDYHPVPSPPEWVRRLEA
jgi:hypothetical protein